VALALSAQRVIEGSIQRPQRAVYTLALALRDLRTGQIVAQESDRCEICSTEDVRRMLRTTAQRLVRAAPPQIARAEASTGTLEVESQPIGAQVLIDGQPQQDRAPATFLLSVGVHSLELRAPGHRPVRRSIEIAPGAPLRLNLFLPAIPPRRPWLTALTVLSAIGAVGLGTASGVLWYYHDRPAYGRDYPTPCLPPQLHCPQKYDNLVPGIATATAAGALLITAGITLYFDFAPRRRPEAAK
jgi:hypothetical protein